MAATMMIDELHDICVALHFRHNSVKVVDLYFECVLWSSVYSSFKRLNILIHQQCQSQASLRSVPTDGLPAEVSPVGA